MLDSKISGTACMDRTEGLTLRDDCQTSLRHFHFCNWHRSIPAQRVFQGASLAWTSVPSNERAWKCYKFVAFEKGILRWDLQIALSIFEVFPFSVWQTGFASFTSLHRQNGSSHQLRLPSRGLQRIRLWEQTLRWPKKAYGNWLGRALEGF